MLLLHLDLPARSDKVAEKPAVCDAWKRAQHCIIPADAF